MAEENVAIPQVVPAAVVVADPPGAPVVPPVTPPTVVEEPDPLPPPGSFKDKLKFSIWKYLGSMFMEQKDGHWTSSLGRVAFAAVFIQAMWIWSGHAKQAELPPTMEHALWALLGFITVGKLPDILGVFKKE